MSGAWPVREDTLGAFGALDGGWTDVDCQSCGACCAFSATWPRFSLEPDAQLDAIPKELVAADESGMRCVNERCSALQGRVGGRTACAIYELRPDVCRACVPGGEDCMIARTRHGLSMGQGA